MKEVFRSIFPLSFYLNDTSFKSFLTLRLHFLRLAGAGWEMGFLWGYFLGNVFRVNEKA